MTTIYAQQIFEVLRTIIETQVVKDKQWHEPEEAYKVISLEKACRLRGWYETEKHLNDTIPPVPITLEGKQEAGVLIPKGLYKGDEQDLGQLIDANFAKDDYCTLIKSGIVVPRRIAAIYAPFTSFNPPEKIFLF